MSELTMEDVKQMFNQTCTSLPKVKVLEEGTTRYRNLSKQLKRHTDPKFWQLIFTKVEQSDFLSGRNGAWCNCAFDWVIKPANLIKIYEGNYDNRKRVMTYKEEEQHYANKRQGDSGDFTLIKDILKNNT